MEFRGTGKSGKQRESASQTPQTSLAETPNSVADTPNSPAGPTVEDHGTPPKTPKNRKFSKATTLGKSPKIGHFDQSEKNIRILSQNRLDPA